MLSRLGISSVCCLTLGTAAVRAQQPGSLFRYIALSPRDTIQLGRPFLASGLADQIAPFTHQLRSGTFGGAERIRILTDSANIITAMEFQYADGTRFADKLRGYVDWLGAPTVRDSTTRYRVVAWQDSVTRFELRVAIVGGREFVATTMIDVLAKW